jgi:hypothetical protein
MNKINLALGHISKILHISDKDIVRVNITHAGNWYTNVYIDRKVMNRIFNGDLVSGEIMFHHADGSYTFTPC